MKTLTLTAEKQLLRKLQILHKCIYKHKQSDSSNHAFNQGLGK